MDTTGDKVNGEHTSMPKEPEKLVESLEGFVECLRQLEIVLEDRPERLYERMNEVFTHLKEIDKNKDVSMQFPVEVFGCIDNNWNPEIFTSDVVRDTEININKTSAKIDLYGKFRSKLESSFDSAYPGEREDFLKMLDGASEKSAESSNSVTELDSTTKTDEIIMEDMAMSDATGLTVMDKST
eukprot:CFRG0137T1